MSSCSPWHLDIDMLRPAILSTEVPWYSRNLCEVTQLTLRQKPTVFVLHARSTARPNTPRRSDAVRPGDREQRLRRMDRDPNTMYGTQAQRLGRAGVIPREGVYACATDAVYMILCSVVGLLREGSLPAQQHGHRGQSSFAASDGTGCSLDRGRRSHPQALASYDMHSCPSHTQCAP